MDFSLMEIEAAKEGGKMGGEYLESIHKTDLKFLNKNEWQTFLECICKEYAMALVKMSQKEVEIPF